MKILRWCEAHLEETIMGVLLILITSIMFIQTILRDIFNTALPWPEELARYCLVATTLLSFAYCIRKGNMLKLDIVVSLIPQKIRCFVILFTELVSLWLYWYLFTHAIDLLRNGLKSVQYSTAMKMPVYIIYGFAVATFGLALIRQFQAIVKSIRGVLTIFNKGGAAR